MRKPLGKSAERVLRMIERQPDIPTREIARRLGLTTQRVYQIEAALRERGLIVVEEAS